MRQCYSFSRMRHPAPLAFVRRGTSTRLVPKSSNFYTRNCLLRFGSSIPCHGRQRDFSSNAATSTAMGDDTMMENATATATVVPSLKEAQQQQQQDDLIRPDDLGSIPYPKALSPSAIMEFKKCPQSFLFQYLYGLKQPTSEALAKGSMCHSALEKVFDLDPEDRTLQVLQDLFRSEWSQNRRSDTYRILFEKTAGEDDTADETSSSSLEWDLQAERQWGQAGLKLLENYFQLEDPRKIVRPNPMKREIWLNSHLSIDPALGATARSNNTDDSDPQKHVFNATEEDLKDDDDDDDDIPTFHVRGIVDRLDMIRTRDSSSQVSLRIVDYKTGEHDTYFTPSGYICFHYNAAWNSRFLVLIVGYLRKSSESQILAIHEQTDH